MTLPRVLATISVGAVVVCVVAFASHERVTGVSFVDALTFHLTQSARWIQTQSMWGVNDFHPLVGLRRVSQQR